MKICHITTVHAALDSRVFYRECMTLKNLGVDISIVGPESEETLINGVKIIPLKKPKSILRRRIFSPWSAVMKALETKADVYHFHDPEIIPAAMYLKLIGKKVVFDVHEYYSEILALKIKGPFFKKIFRYLFHLLLELIPNKVFDKLVFPTISFSQEYGNLSKNVAIVNLPLSKDLDVDTDTTKNDHKYDVVHLGTISEVRMTFILEVARLTNEKRSVKWLFLGVRKNVIAWVNKNYDKEFLKNITFIERVPFKEVKAYMESCKIGFNYHPYDKKFLIAIPMKVFEYLQFGLPAITTALPEMKRYLTHKENAFLIDGENVMDYANAVNEILDDEQLRAKLIKNGYYHVKNEISFEESEGPKMIKMYKELIGEKE